MSNPYRLIKQLALLTGLWMVVTTAVQAQQSYYIYIQSDNGQPFYTQIGDKVYSSSAVGHLIISGLKDNVCNLEIGFPQHTSRPQQFSVPIRGKDHGYQLKKNGSQDWALVSWQGQETIKPKKGPGSSDLLYGERKKDDAFATLMAAVVNDSAVLYTSIVKNDAPVVPSIAKTEEKQPVAQTVRDTASTAIAAVNATPDTAKLYRNDKPLFDTTTAAAKVHRNEKPLLDTTTAVAKVYKNDKPLFDTTTKTSPPISDTAATLVQESRNDKPLYDTAKAVVTEYRNDKPLYDTTAAIAKSNNNNTSIIDLTTGKPLYDTAEVSEAADEPAPKESDKALVKPVKKQDQPGVIKVQQTNKDGETKIVFIDSSESPAAVVTVYITEDTLQQKTPAQPVATDLTSASPKTETEPKPGTEKKTETGKKTDTVLKEESAPKTEPADTKKEVSKAPITSLPANKDAGLQVEVVSTAVPPVTEKPKSEKPKIVSEKPAGQRGDTLVVILGSPQQKRDTAVKANQEAPKPLYAPRETTLSGTEKPAGQKTTSEPVNNDISTETDKAAGKTGRKGRAAKNADNNAAVTEPAAKQGTKDTGQTAVSSNNQVDVATQNDKPVANTVPAGPKKEAPRALYDPKPTELDKKVVMINSDCNRFATDTDVDKLRVKMLNEKDAAKRVAVANKVFKTMCLTAKQIKALTELFPDDESKYKFLEMAYPFAADTGNFKELFELFSSESYQTKFKTLVRY